MPRAALVNAYIAAASRWHRRRMRRVLTVMVCGGNEWRFG